ncbi:hypothetical protein [Pedobacter sp. ASV28]|uniref:hypothetical protein n=1 Tax=Pedobacter sp. ASV28 TaxID=2795123 RepID=UPI0018EBD801|nr:hypothetical protein [Pedobacter sp. ASV28]
MISKNDPDFILEEYKGYTIASHKSNVAKKDVNNFIVVYQPNAFPENGFIIGLDDSKSSGRRKTLPHNMEDAKRYVDCVLKVRQQNEIAQPKKDNPSVIKRKGRRL